MSGNGPIMLASIRNYKTMVRLVVSVCRRKVAMLFCIVIIDTILDVLVGGSGKVIVAPVAEEIISKGSKYTAQNVNGDILFAVGQC